MLHYLKTLLLTFAREIKLKQLTEEKMAKEKGKNYETLKNNTMK